ncbi:NUDIX hydrolase [Haliscomenobacter hydrossis]|uniref:NUDIX hydrolase n=1 Tax=Haliscomenobacter hydrossis (strain ATCC 27775 / DSM 1100 / LMG 10767 / O) TaxID=760192 RepID=F4KSR4_HALH1|nr:NUDIX domain-containing protein [Haliscomenobacter hydrossis]AEE48028.1 NUDIX hydrolase [Haliscomenobacter hydrossis DSM 1100]
MISVLINEKRFNYRIAAVILNEGRVLVHRGEQEDFWSLPGGRCEMMEFSADTLKREMMEEIGEELEIGKLLWLVENMHVFNDREVHELCFFYQANLSANSPLLKEYEFIGYEPDAKLIYQWQDLAQIQSLDLKPAFLQTGLVNLPLHIEHICVSLSE